MLSVTSPLLPSLFIIYEIKDSFFFFFFFGFPAGGGGNVSYKKHNFENENQPVVGFLFI